MVNSGAVFVLWTSGFLFGLCASTVKALARTDWAIRSDYMRNASTLHCPNALPIPCINHCHHSQYLVQILEPQYKTIQEYRRSNLNFRDKLALTKLLKNVVSEFSHYHLKYCLWLNSCIISLIRNALWCLIVLQKDISTTTFISHAISSLNQSFYCHRHHADKMLKVRGNFQVT